MYKIIIPFCAYVGVHNWPQRLITIQ